MLLAGGLFLAGCGIASVQPNTNSAQNANAAVPASAQKAETAPSAEKNPAAGEEVSPEATATVNTLSEFYVAEKNDRTTVVYKENIDTEARDELFRFTEPWRYDPESGNSYEGFGPGVDYSASRNQFVYADENGLFLYDPSNQQKTTLLEKVGTNGEFDGIPIPVWSKEGINARTFKLLHPLFSGDGRYVSFVESFHEGSDTAIIDTSAQTISHFHADDDDSIGMHDIDWSDTGHKLTVGSPRPPGYNTPGLFFADSEPFSPARNILNDENISVGRSVFISEDIIAFSSHPAEANPTNDEGTSSEIFTINTDGSDMKSQVDGGRNTVMLGGAENFFYTKDAEDNTQDGLWVGFYRAGGGAHIARGKTYDAYIPQAYTTPLVAVASTDDRSDNTSESRVELFDINSLVATYTSPHSLIDGAVQFLGFAK